MIEPTASDIGRAVVYRSFAGSAPEQGIITSLPEPPNGCAFVRFRGPGGELTPCRKLEWIG